jgi:hypothetical protein
LTNVAFERTLEVTILYYKQQCIAMNIVRLLSQNNSLALFGDMNCVWSTGSCMESKIGKKQEMKERKKERFGIAGEWKLRRIR